MNANQRTITTLLGHYLVGVVVKIRLEKESEHIKAKSKINPNIQLRCQIINNQ